MNKQQAHMEQMVALLLLTYTIGVLSGEALRALLCGLPSAATVPTPAPLSNPVPLAQPKWKRFSGLFLLLQRTCQLTTEQSQRLLRQIRNAVHSLVFGPVRSPV
jgi:hypothetical protein